MKCLQKAKNKVNVTVIIIIKRQLVTLAYANTFDLPGFKSRDFFALFSSDILNNTPSLGLFVFKLHITVTNNCLKLSMLLD